jgi:hypothetical protein
MRLVLWLAGHSLAEALRLSASGEGSTISLPGRHGDCLFGSNIPCGGGF